MMEKLEEKELLFPGDVDLQQRVPTPPPTKIERSNQPWLDLAQYVKSETKISLDIVSLRNRLKAFDDEIIPASSLYKIIGISVRGYTRGVLRDTNILQAVVDYMEILGLVIPMSMKSGMQRYMVNFDVEKCDINENENQLDVVQEIKTYVKMLIK